MKDPNKLTQAKLNIMFLRLIFNYFDEEYFLRYIQKLVAESNGGETSLFAQDTWTRRDEYTANIGGVNNHFLITINLTV